ncbi:hypothetical protein NDU88_006495 [Pleurodeles waltl]|uniref:Uncharacterized protein n=1 Tax=Pleurodeles waltl TaxID=8319 RepID=A0AAV7QP80_PLEWA|nr:hypothetical protein NDU88_006495 [Pleurodeles waltl]
MPSNRVSAGKRKGRDPELSQLLKLVLAKLGNGDSDSGDSVSDNEDNVAGSGRPRWSHVAPRAAFPPVKHRNKGRVAAAQPPLSSPAAITSPEQSPMLDTLLPSTSATSEPYVGGENSIPAPGHGVADMLADIYKSLATLAAPSLGQVVQPSPQPLASAPATPSTVRHTQASPTPHVSTQAQDQTAQAFLAVSRLLATINVPENNRPHNFLDFE